MLLYYLLNLIALIPKQVRYLPLKIIFSVLGVYLFC